MGGFRQWLGGLLRVSAPQRLIDAQKTLGGEPVVTLAVGAHSLDGYVVAYKYEEAAQEVGSLAVWLDNREGNFDDLATDWPDLTRGAAVDLRRGLKVNGVATTEKLPRCWINTLQYLHDEGAGMLLLDCIDWWGKLEAFRYASKQEWSDTNIRTIAEAILAQVGLTLAGGSFGFSIDHEVDVTEDGDEALMDLMDKVDEFLYTGLDGEIRFKTLDAAEAAGYSYDWSSGGGANHPLMRGTEIAESSAEYNKVTVNGSGSYTGTAEDTTESGLVGTRLRTISDESLTSDAQCLERAQAELSFWQARSTAGTLVARPHFTLQLYDVVSVAAPPWGGPALAKARVTGIVEKYGWGDWEQEVTVGDLPEQSLLHVGERPGRGRKSSAGRKGRKVTRRTSSGKKRRSTRQSYARRDHTHEADEIPTPDDLGVIPSGCIVMWSGAVGSIPSGWALCNGSNGTPDLRGSFIVGAGGSYGVSDTGGQDTADLRHTHGPGSLATDSDSHTHGPGTLATDSDSHSHGVGTLATVNDTHAHDLPQPEDTGGPDNTNRGVSMGTGVYLPDENHVHSIPNIGTEDDTHNHAITGSTASDAHGHEVDSGETGSDAHGHEVDSGVTASGGEAAHDNRPVFYALAFIMKL